MPEPPRPTRRPSLKERLLGPQGNAPQPAAVIIASVVVAAMLFGIIAVVPGGDDEPLIVWSSFPLRGPQNERFEDMNNAMRLALSEAGGKAGDRKIVFRALDDSDKRKGGWTRAAVTENALKAARNDRTAVYVGEYNSGASAVSIPILSGAKIAQISPGNTAVGLTTDETGAEAGEPEMYYVDDFRNYVRIVPRDTVQGDALATIMRQDRCRRVAILNDKEVASVALVKNVKESLKILRVPVVLDEQIETPDVAPLVARIGQQRADCFMFGGVTNNNAVEVVDAVGTALPDVKVYGGDGVADRGFAKSLSPSVANRARLTNPAVGPEDLRRGRAFLAAFEESYDSRDPDPFAIYAYEAMKLALDAIERADSTDRVDIVDALFETRDRSSPLGTYSLDDNGDTTLSNIGLYEITDGATNFVNLVQPHPKLASRRR